MTIIDHVIVFRPRGRHSGGFITPSPELQLSHLFGSIELVVISVTRTFK